MLRRDLNIPVAHVPVHVLVLDADVGEMDLVVVIRQVVLEGPFLDLFAAAIRPSVVVSVALIALMEEALVVAFQLAVELHPENTGLLLPEAFCLLH